MMRRSGAKQYQQMQAQTTLEGASPHKLILLLFNGAQEKLAMAKGYMQHGDIEMKSGRITAAINIIEELRSILDLKKGGELASNLDSLYDYMLRRLVQANMKNDVRMIEEVIELIREISAGWSEMAVEAKAA